MKSYLKIIIAVLLTCIFVVSESCAVRDCKGRKKTAKTNMGGWL